MFEHSVVILRGNLIRRRRRVIRYLKPVMDYTIGTIGFILSFPLLAVIAVIMKIVSPGPIFYLQERVGKKGKIFKIIKIRTMIPCAEEQSGPVWAKAQDPRVTKFGRFLRKTHLDELPQFINVLNGDMSIIGPRPERPVFVDNFKKVVPYYQMRLKVKPGITGLAQVKHHYDKTLSDVKKKLVYDLMYLKKQSIVHEIMILFTTIWRVLLRKGGLH